MAKVNFISWQVTYVDITCDCGENVKVQGDLNMLGQQDDFGEVKIKAECPHCGKEINTTVDLAQYPTEY